METKPVKRVHFKFMKNILVVKKWTPSALVHGELGAYSLIVHRLIRIIKYCKKILECSAHRYIVLIYKSLLSLSELNPYGENWVTLLRDTLYKFGFGYLWVSQGLSNYHGVIVEFKQLINGMYSQM